MTVSPCNSTLVSTGLARFAPVPGWLRTELFAGVKETTYLMAGGIGDALLAGCQLRERSQAAWRRAQFWTRLAQL